MRRRPRTILAACVLVALWLGLGHLLGGGAAVGPPGSARPEGEGAIPPSAEVPRLDCARAQMELAACGRRAARRGGEGGRELAADAYRAVRTYHPGERSVGAEAAFRAGELLRAAGRLDEALVELRIARELGQGNPLAVRAELEVGHVHRRSGRFELALDAYCSVQAHPDAPQRFRDDAGLWEGRAWLELGRPEDARRSWERVARAAEDPVDRVRAFDLMALAWIESGDLEAAAGALDRARIDLGDAVVERTERGERVRRALARMRCIPRLRRAIAARARAGGDARPGESHLSVGAEADETPPSVQPMSGSM